MTPETDINGWPSKMEVVQQLGAGFSLRSLEYMIHSGKIRVAYRPVPHRRAMTVCNPADVATVARERRAAMQPVVDPIMRPADIAQPRRMPMALARTATGLQSGLWSWPALSLKEKLYLTIDEAVEYSGLPKSYLYQRIKNGILLAVKADRWLRISRKSLETL